jgi:hypothetical protein
MKLPKAIALWLALRGAKTKEERTRARRKVGSRYAKRKPRKLADTIDDRSEPLV